MVWPTRQNLRNDGVFGEQFEDYCCSTVVTALEKRILWKCALKQVMVTNGWVNGETFYNTVATIFKSWADEEARWRADFTIGRRNGRFISATGRQVKAQRATGLLLQWIGINLKMTENKPLPILHITLYLLLQDSRFDTELLTSAFTRWDRPIDFKNICELATGGIESSCYSTFINFCKQSILKPIFILFADKLASKTRLHVSCFH